MVKLLDARTSQNASYANSILSPITVLNAPELVGQIGLQTAGATGVVRVQFTGSVSLFLPVLSIGVAIAVVRGTLPTDPLVYSLSEVITVGGQQTFTFTGSDFNPPLAPQLTYTMFVAVTAVGAIRVGPESFNGAAYSD